MRTLAFLGAASVCTLLAGACGLDSGGLGDVPTDDGGGGSTLDHSASSDGNGSGNDGSVNDGPGSDGPGKDGTTPTDSGSAGDTYVAPEVGADTSVPETSTGCTTGNGCYVIPSGWTLVAFAGNQSNACPTGFATAPPANLVEGPNTSNGCTCGQCAVSQQPSCPDGPVQDYYSSPQLLGGSNCSNQGMPTQNNNSPAGQCLSDMYSGPNPFPYGTMSLKYIPPAATGGTCSAPGVTNAPGVTYGAHDRACTADSNASAGCTGNQCTPTLPPTYKPCVVSAGQVGCPGAPFTVQHVVGTAATYSCSVCSSCAVTADCTGTMKLFTNGGCNQNELDIPADGQCHAANAPRDSYSNYAYQKAPPSNVVCNVTGSSSAQSVGLAGEETICCPP